VVDEADTPRLRAATRSLNVALRLKMGCARIALSASEADSSFPPTTQIIAAMGKENIDVIHLTRDSAMLAVIVAEQHASRAADLIAHLCSVRPGAAACLRFRRARKVERSPWFSDNLFFS
jgi:hypothetical protein